MTDIPKPKTSGSTGSTTSVSSTDLEPTEEEKELMKNLDQREVTYVAYLNKAGLTWKYKFHDIKLDKEITIHTQVEPRDLPVTFKYTKDYCIPFLPIKGKERYRTIADRFIELIYELPDPMKLNLDKNENYKPFKTDLESAEIIKKKHSIPTTDGDDMVSTEAINQLKESESLNRIRERVKQKEQSTDIIPSVGDDKPIRVLDSGKDQGSQSLTETPNKNILELNLENIKKYFKLEKFSDQAIEMSLQLCIHQNLNPFINDVYLIPFNENATNRKIQMVVSKDVFLKKAEQHDDYEGFEAGLVLTDEEDEIVFLPGSFVPPNHTLQGGYARVFRKGMKDFRAVVGIKEYKSENPKSLWAKLENTMIRKVALVQCLREAFPVALHGMYDKAEMGDMN